PEASSAIAAAEVVAAAYDRQLTRLPKRAQKWLEQYRDSILAPPLLTAARLAVERVLTQSELKGLWGEDGPDGPGETWAKGVRELRRRLQATPPLTAKAKEPKRPRRPEAAFAPGAVLRVDLDGEWHTYARILARIPKIAFYDCRVASPMDDLPAIV